MTYTKHGPFTNNSGPGIDANFLNDVESALIALNPSAIDPGISSVDGSVIATGYVYTIDPDNARSAAVVQGTVSGSCYVYQYICGEVNSIKIFCSNYKSSAAQTIRLPFPMNGPGNSIWHVSELQGGKLEALANGVAQTFSIQTGTAVGGGSQAPQAFINSWSFGMLRGGFDTLRITVTGTTPTSCVCTIEG